MILEEPRVVLTAGSFDLLHVGHLALLRECAKLAGKYGRVIVAVNTDEFITKFKRQPVIPFAQRVELVQAIRYVHDVVPNDGLDQSALIASLEPDVLAVGVDWATRDYYSQVGVTSQWLYERGISLVYVAHEHSLDISSTMLRTRLSGA